MSGTKTNASTNSPAPVGVTTEEKLAKAEKELREATALVEASGASVRSGDLSVRRGLLQRVVRLYQQQLSFASELQGLKERRAQLMKEAETWSGFGKDPRPFSILLVDSLREAIQVERTEIQSGEAALGKLVLLAQEQRVVLENSEARVRQLNEQLEKGVDPGDLTRIRELERLRSQTAAATIGVLDLERQVKEERMAASRARLQLLGRQLAIANADARFSDSDLQTVRDRLDREYRRLEQDLAEAEARRLKARQNRLAAVEQLALAQRQSGTNLLALTRANELAELRRTQLETAETVVTSLGFILQAATVERTIWEVRFASYRSNSAETIRQTEKRLAEFRRRIELWRDYYRQQLESASMQVTLQEERLSVMEGASEVASLVQERLQALRERDQILLRVVRSIERGDRLVLRLEEGLRDAASKLPILDRVRNAASDSRSLLERIWTFELFVAQDTITVDGQQITGKRSVTLGKVVSAILILVIGYWLTGLVSRVIEPFVIKRFKIDANQADLIRRWFRVVLIFSLAIFSLVSVRIPLTVFAFAGGALAIGLGFGMQTMLKNFVSGIIILFERPFRVGDVLDVSGQRGTVVGIGIRSSVLQQWDGTETLIPNSTLLENSVTNWTYSDRKVRFTVAVGVAYGSDTRRVVQLLAETAGRHGLVEKTPAPQVLFTNFGQSTLDFELRFWVNVITANSGLVASDLRQMITGTFAENGIVIAYPQHDVNLSAHPPLQVQVVSALKEPTQGNGAKSIEPAHEPVPDGRTEKVVTEVASKLP